MGESQEGKVQSQSSEQKAEPTPPSQPSIPPVSTPQPSVSWKTVGITAGVVTTALLLLVIITGGRQGRWKEWREKRQPSPTVYQPPPTASYPSPTAVSEQPTSTPIPTAPPSIPYEVSITEAEWNDGLKDEVAESQNRTHPLTSLTVSLYEDSGRVNAVWTTGAAYTAELYVDETGKELRLRYPEFTGAGSFDETYRNAVTDVFQAEITTAVKEHFSNRLDHIELHYGKVVFFYN